ncbi:helix-turn-helix domain-containing protein [Natronorubrum daqingense]|uniref:DNA-binding transcriptional regulator n=1 Tax=Natronorubrum daqingense TaxID=588898 RepID=A0A1N7BYY6_9EURY|nr:helix-turn-helix domain-containing protein [Natronorubrum daqingense]APX96654.1 DNA-binding transcriptional regulator [Natronorubrum daqingense]SIR56414.1 IclR helix-turn-helix domain-containing protein [Natronorubrum daqingense]
MPDHEHTDPPRARDVFEALETSSPTTVVELATALDSHPATIERHCQTLQRNGSIRQCTGGMYTLAERDEDAPATSLADSHATATNPAD